MIEKLTKAKVDTWLVEQTAGEADLALAFQARSAAPAAPIRISDAGPSEGGRRALSQNSTISATTPSAHSTPITVPP